MIEGSRTEAERAAREPTFGDCMRSRLTEMCVRIEMTGENFRQTVKKAAGGSCLAFEAWDGLTLLPSASLRRFL
jgi:hypothetical protein